METTYVAPEPTISYEDEEEVEDEASAPDEEKSPFDIAAEQINAYGENDNMVDELERESIEFGTETESMPESDEQTEPAANTSYQ